MARRERPSPGRAVRLFTVTVLVAAGLAGTGVAARAGLGSLTKSAKDKAAQAVGQKPSPPAQGAPPQFDATTVELTGDVLDKLIACRKAANDVTQDRQKLVERSAQIEKELNELQAKNGQAISDNGNKRNDVQNCRSGEFERLKHDRMEQLIMHTQGNADLIRRLSEYSAAASQAMAAGDTAKYNLLQQQLYQLAGFTRADTVAIDKKCGQVPPVHPAQIRIDALQKEGNDVLAKIRAMDEQAIQVQKEKCGMNDEQLGQAWDRIKKYLAGDPTAGFSDAELKALGERKDVLKPLAI
jgi:hypothetical protein